MEFKREVLFTLFKCPVSKDGEPDTDYPMAVTSSDLRALGYMSVEEHATEQKRTYRDLMRRSGVDVDAESRHRPGPCIGDVQTRITYLTQRANKLEAHVHDVREQLPSVTMATPEDVEKLTDDAVLRNSLERATETTQHSGRLRAALGMQQRCPVGEVVDAAIGALTESRRLHDEVAAKLREFQGEVAVLLGLDGDAARLEILARAKALRVPKLKRAQHKRPTTAKKGPRK